MKSVAARIASALRRSTGLEVALIGASSVERAVSQRIGQLTADGEALDVDGYAARVESDLDERQWLIEAVVVPETWFFRHRQAFDFLVQAARARLAHPSRLGMPLRIASVPCSTGEEPYSIAMALLDAGFSEEMFSIDAIDISSAAIEQAQAGRFGRNAFRGEMLDFRGRYFKRQADDWVLDPRVRSMVAFRQGNLVSEAVFNHPKYYDIVFCRNVLIYFDRAIQKMVVSRLADCLRDDGVLFVGPAESALASAAGFTACEAQLSFAFQRQAPTTKPQVQARILARAVGALTATKRPHPVPDEPAHGRAHRASIPASRGGLIASATPAAKIGAKPGAKAAVDGMTKRAATASATSSAKSAKEGASEGATRISPGVSVTFADAERLANRGNLVEAEAACQQVIDATGPSADVYCLLGVIADSTQRPQEAREHFRRAVYLDSTHAGALTQFAAHLAMEGDEAGAERLLGRARRAHPDLF